MKKSILVAILFLSGFGALHAQTRQTREQYIDRYKHIAVAHMERYGIPASITLAQGILESDCGMITIKGANLHVSRLSVEKGELDIDGTIESYAYSEVNSYAKKGESMLGRLFR